VTTNPELENLPVYSSISKIRKYLQSKAEAGELSWTVLACGAFLDFVVNSPVLLDWEHHAVAIFDDGENRISSTSLPVVGKAVAAILQNFDATKNKIVRTSEIILTQNQVLGIAKELRPDVLWTVSKIQTSVMLQEGLDLFATGDFSMSAVMKLIKGTALAGDKYGGAYDVTDNELLGVKELTLADLRRLIAEKLA